MIRFQHRLEYHDHVLKDVLPDAFAAAGFQFVPTGVEKQGADVLSVVGYQSDAVSIQVRWRPDGIASDRHSRVFVELKTKLPEQTARNYSVEMPPLEVGKKRHLEGELVAYLFWPAQRVVWVDYVKPFAIRLPAWRWSTHDVGFWKHRYPDTPCDLQEVTKDGSGTVFGLVSEQQVARYTPFNQFWQEVAGTWHGPKQLSLI